MALANKKAVSAIFAAPIDSSWPLINATAEKLLIPIVDRLSRVKKIVRERMGGVRRFNLGRSGNSFAALFPFGIVWAAGTQVMTNAVERLIAPAARSAVPIPPKEASNNIQGGATAPPKNPAKV